MPVLAWMFVIFAASTDLGSAEHTSRFLVPLLRWFNPHVSVATIVFFQFLIRKAAHLSEYAILAIILLRAVRSEMKGSLRLHAAMVFVVGAVYAITDEFHQSFSAVRTASPRDVMIDSFGVLVGLAIYALVVKGKPARIATVEARG